MLELPIFEHPDRLFCREMFREMPFFIIVPVMADPAQVAQKVSDSDGPSLSRKIRDIFLHFIIQFEFPILHEPENPDRCYGLGNRGQSITSIRIGRDFMFQVSVAETFFPEEIILVKSDAKRGEF
jgi:hypothetical protein